MHLTILVTALILSVWSKPAAAQAWNVDARAIAMAGIGGDNNVFTSSVDASRGDRSFVLPLGLVQTLQNLEVFKARSTAFDPARAVEIAGNPFHLQFGSTRTGTAAAFVHGIRNATFSRDLNDYRGFVPESFTAEGVITPKWGYTFRIGKGEDGRTHSLFAGGGPHIALRTRVAADPQMVSVLDGDGDTYLSNESVGLLNQSRAEAAAAITGGYRGRYALARGGLAFVSVNYNTLVGLRLEDVDLAFRLNTDNAGALQTLPGQPALAFDRVTSSRGIGMAVDVGGGMVVGRWEFGVSGNNLGHRMSWKRPTQRRYELDDVFSGVARFESTPAASLQNIRTNLPVDYRGNVTFRGRSLSFRGEVAREWGRVAFRGGVEHDGGRLQTRLAAALIDQAWFPTAGISVGVSRKLALDLAGFTTQANIERVRRFAVAASLRITPVP